MAGKNILNDTKLKKEIKVLLFDLDGTLIDMHNIVKVLTSLSMILRFRKYMGAKTTLKTMARAIKTIKTNTNDTLNIQTIIDVFKTQTQCPEDELRAIFNKILYQDFKKLKFFFKKVPFATTVLKSAQDKNYRLVLATNPLFEFEAVKLRMNWGDIDENIFEYITHNENSTRCKPNIEYYQLLLEKLNLKTHECLMIGNDFKKDLPASKIGIPVFMLNNSKNQDSIQDEIYYQGSLEDLNQWILSE